MPKTCYCGLKPSRRICKYMLLTLILAYFPVKRNIRKKGRDECTLLFFHNHTYQGGTGKFIYKALTLDNR